MIVVIYINPSSPSICSYLPTQIRPHFPHTSVYHPPSFLIGSSSYQGGKPQTTHLTTDWCPTVSLDAHTAPPSITTPRRHSRSRCRLDPHRQPSFIIWIPHCSCCLHPGKNPIPESPWMGRALGPTVRYVEGVSASASTAGCTSQIEGHCRSRDSEGVRNTRASLLRWLVICNLKTTNCLALLLPISPPNHSPYLRIAVLIARASFPTSSTQPTSPC